MNKVRIISALLLILFMGTSHAWQETPRPKVGVALAGGGAKGAAHIGVLKYLEEIGIPVDYVAGTSIGSIVGGFYALGYSPSQLDTIISGMDWGMYMSSISQRGDLPISFRKAQDTYFMSIPFNTGDFRSDMSQVLLSSLPSAFISGNRITNLFNSLSMGYLDSISFDSLPIPFACVATDVKSGNPVVFRSGHLPLAIRSSMAIPGVFAPVYYGDKILYDGGFVENFPVKLCKQMGADIVIGIDISDSLFTEESQLRSLPQLLWQLTGIAMKSDAEHLKPLCDLYIHPDISGYTTLSFSSEAIDSLILRGYRAAQMHREEFLAIKQRVDPQGTYQKQLSRPKAVRFDTIPMIVSQVNFNGVPRDKERWLKVQGGIYKGMRITKPILEHTLNLLEGSGYYNDITYRVDRIPSSGEMDSCKVSVFLHEAQPHNLSFGARFDSEESAALLFHLGFNQCKSTGFQFSLDGKLNHNAAVGVDLSYVSSMGKGARLSYDYQRSNFSLGTTFSRRYSNLTADHHRVQLSRVRGFSSDSYMDYGLEEDVYVMDSNLSVGFLGNGELAGLFSAPGHTGPFLKMGFDNFNDGYFPTHGGCLNLNLHWRFLNSLFYSMVIGDRDSYWGFADIEFDFQKALPIGSRVCVIPQMFHRVVIGEHINLYDNIVGGVLRGRYAEQQLPFIGFTTPQRVENLAHILRMDLRFNVSGIHYLTLIGNYLFTASSPEYYFTPGEEFHQALGVGLRYSLKLPYVGPLSMDLSWNTLTRRVGFYFNFGCMF